MNIKKCLFTISALAIVGITTTSCSGSGLKHESSATLKAYNVDLNHDGILGEDETNLTWVEAYDTLISEANSPRSNGR